MELVPLDSPLESQFLDWTYHGFFKIQNSNLRHEKTIHFIEKTILTEFQSDRGTFWDQVLVCVSHTFHIVIRDFEKKLF